MLKTIDSVLLYLLLLFPNPYCLELMAQQEKLMQIEQLINQVKDKEIDKNQKPLHFSFLDPNDVQL